MNAAIEIRDIHFADYAIWENVLQTGYLLLLALFIAAVWSIWWIVRRRNKHGHKRFLLRQLAGVSAIDVPEANALLYGFFYRTGTQTQPVLARNRDGWRKKIIAHNPTMPQLAELLAYHYRDTSKPDGAWLLTQLRQYIRHIR